LEEDVITKLIQRGFINKLWIIIQLNQYHMKKQNHLF
jgi:hypothetical protein